MAKPPQKSLASSESIFFQNILHFLLSTHLIPLIEYSFQYTPQKQAKLVTMKTTSGEDLTTNLEELPRPSGQDFIQLSARILINGCYEILKESPLKEKVSLEVFEFFRHIRNASSHNGKFIFRNHEPKSKAVWRKLEITKNLQGSDLFEFLAVGDVILLLQDIEDWQTME